MTYPLAVPVPGWEECDDALAAMNAAGERHGAPPNAVRVIVHRESTCNWARDGNRSSDVHKRKKPDGSPNLILPYSGIYETTAATWGYDFAAMVGDQAMQVDAVASGLARLNRDYGTTRLPTEDGGTRAPLPWENAFLVYHGGTRALTREGYRDERGIVSREYADRALANMAALDAKSTGGGMAAPKKYDLAVAADGRRFDVEPWEWEILRGKCYPGRRGMTPKIVVLHIQDGYTKGSLNHHIHAVSASATIYANRDGTLVYGVREADAPWTNGDVQAPSARMREVMARFGPDPNVYALTIEAEDFPANPMPAVETEAIAWQVKEWMARFAIPSTMIFGHLDINSVTRAHCGKYAAEIIRRVQTTPPPTVPGVVYPAHLNAAIAKRLFGRAIGEDGKVYEYTEGMALSTFWLTTYGPKHGHLQLQEVWSYAGGKERYFVYEGGPPIYIGPDFKPVIVGA